MATTPDKTPHGTEPGVLPGDGGGVAPAPETDAGDVAEGKSFDPFRYQANTVPPGLRAELFAVKARPVSGRRWEDTVPPLHGEQASVAPTSDPGTLVGPERSSRAHEMHVESQEERAGAGRSLLPSSPVMIGAWAIVVGVVLGLAWALGTGESREPSVGGRRVNEPAVPIVHAPDDEAGPSVSVAPASPGPSARRETAPASSRQAPGAAHDLRVPGTPVLRSGAPAASTRPAPAAPSFGNGNRRPDIETPLLPE